MLNMFFMMDDMMDDHKQQMRLLQVRWCRWMTHWDWMSLLLRWVTHPNTLSLAHSAVITLSLCTIDTILPLRSTKPLSPKPPLLAGGLSTLEGLCGGGTRPSSIGCMYRGEVRLDGCDLCQGSCAIGMLCLYGVKFGSGLVCALRCRCFDGVMALTIDWARDGYLLLGLLSKVLALLTLPLCVAWYSVLPLNLNREPRRVKSLRVLLLWVGCLSRKKAWLSTEHFHKCLHSWELESWNTNVCSCSRPFSSSSTTSNVSRFFLKSRRVILGQKKRPILLDPSKTRIPVGVSPRAYSPPSRPCTSV